MFANIADAIQLITTFFVPRTNVPKSIVKDKDLRDRGKMVKMKGYSCGKIRSGIFIIVFAGSEWF